MTNVVFRTRPPLPSNRVPARIVIFCAWRVAVKSAVITKVFMTFTSIYGTAAARRAKGIRWLGAWTVTLCGSMLPCSRAPCGAAAPKDQEMLLG